jgi:cyclopropane-fatty-acyl-phospholipid synthase
MDKHIEPQRKAMRPPLPFPARGKTGRVNSASPVTLVTPVTSVTSATPPKLVVVATPAVETLHADAALRLLHRLFKNFKGAAAFRLPDGKVHYFGRSTSPFTLVVHDLTVLRQMVVRRSPLPLVEGYINGLIEVEGDLYAALGLKHYFNNFDLSMRERWLLLRDAWRLPAKHRSESFTQHDGVQESAFSHQHSRDSDSAAVSFHYDVSNAFYALWLDWRMVYSCAYFHAPDETLEQAQANKLDLVCRKLRLEPGQYFLDVGCGWGALICWAAQHYQVRAHGITLSRKQYEYAKARIQAEGLSHLVTVEMRDYRDLQGEAVYDKVASVGMFEHVGLDNLPLYHATIDRVLRPGGLFLNHGVTHDAEGWERNVNAEFINRYVFPDAELDTISNIQRSMEQAGFEIHDIEGLRPHYALTLRHWVQRLEEQHAQALEYVSEATYRVWRFYMSACALEFESGGAGIYQVLASRRGGAKPPMPLTRQHLYTASKGAGLAR